MKGTLNGGGTYPPKPLETIYENIVDIADIVDRPA